VFCWRESRNAAFRKQTMISDDDSGLSRKITKTPWRN